MKQAAQSAVVRRAAHRVRGNAAADIARMRSDAGLTLAQLSRGSGIDASYLARIEAANVAPSIETYARIAEALGADLTIRLYPNTGPTIRDRHQAGILEALLAILHPRWRAFPEIAVRRPSRGWIDVGLFDTTGLVFVAVEIQSELRRIEQLVRWSGEKAASVPSWAGWAALEVEPVVSQLLLVRETRTTRAVAQEFRRMLRASFPAHPDDARASLAQGNAWPGPAILWARGRGTSQDPWRLVPRP